MKSRVKSNYSGGEEIQCTYTTKDSSPRSLQDAATGDGQN